MRFPRDLRSCAVLLAVAAGVLAIAPGLAPGSIGARAQPAEIEVPAPKPAQRLAHSQRSALDRIRLKEWEKARAGHEKR